MTGAATARRGCRGFWNVASQLGDRVDAWEIWNEPDQPMLQCGEEGYNPGMPWWEYGPLLRDAYLAIRDAGAGAPIVTGGLDSGNVQYIVQAASAAGGLWADGVSVHPYGVVPDGTWCPNPGEDLNCEWGTLGGKVDEYHAWTGLPIWITEWGSRRRTPRTRRATCATATLRLRAAARWSRTRSCSAHPMRWCSRSGSRSPTARRSPMSMRRIRR